MSQVEVLVRKVDVLRWTTEERHGCDPADVPATLIQHNKELSAKECCLSFWLVNTENERWQDDAFLALMGARTNSRIDAMHLAFVDLEPLKIEGIEIRETAGDTHFLTLAGLHRDAVRLDGHRLAIVAQHINAAIAQGKVLHRTSSQLVDILAQAVNDRKLAKLAQLPQYMKQALANRQMNG